MQGVASLPQGIGEGNIHPLAEIGPGREVLARPGNRLGRRQRHDIPPFPKVAVPLPVQTFQAAITTFKPVTEGLQRYRGKIEIPIGRKIGDAGFVAKAVIKRPQALLRHGDIAQPQADILAPGRVGKARPAHERAKALRVFAVLCLQRQIAPVDGLVRKEPVVGRVKIGGDVFVIPAQSGCEQRCCFSPLDVKSLFLGEQLAGRNTLPSQRREGRRRLGLPHDDLVIPPIGRRRQGHESGFGRVPAFFRLAGRPGTIHCQARNQIIEGGNRAPQIQRKGNTVPRPWINRTGVFHDQAPGTVGPSQRQHPTAGDGEARKKVNPLRAVPERHRSGKFQGPGIGDFAANDD